MSARKPLLALDRAALMMQLVPYLVGKGEVSVADAADEFDVTPAQMRAMVQKLTVIGLPGESGFWQLPHELFDIDWDLLDARDVIAMTNSVGLEHAPRLTAREAAALLAGLQLAGSLPGMADSDVIRGLLGKLSRGVSATPADVIVAPGPVDAARDVVDHALKAGVAVSFSYKAPDAPLTRRTVDPIKVLIAGGQWYLQGWCHLREAPRTFHLDRVSALELTDIAVTHGDDAVPELFENNEHAMIARIRFDAASAPLLADYLDRADVDTHSEPNEATMRVADECSLRRLASRRAGDVEIVSPPAARRAAQQWAEAGLAQYQ